MSQVSEVPAEVLDVVSDGERVCVICGEPVKYGGMWAGVHGVPNGFLFLCGGENCAEKMLHLILDARFDTDHNIGRALKIATRPSVFTAFEELRTTFVRFVSENFWKKAFLATASHLALVAGRSDTDSEAGETDEADGPLF